MKIRRIYIEDFKNLKKVEAVFESDKLVSTIIGRNGSGKSNLIEFIVKIFRDLDKEIFPDYSYQLEYTCRQRINNKYPFSFAEKASTIKICVKDTSTSSRKKDVQIEVYGKKN